MNRGDLLGPARRPVLPRRARLVHLVVLVQGLLDGVVAARPGVVAVAAGIHAPHVDLGLAVDHPLRQVLAGAGPLGHADGGAVAVPVVAQPRRRSHEEARVGRVRDGPRHHLADARVAEGGDAHRRPLQALLEAVQVGRGEVEVQVPVHPVHAVGLRSRHLVRADQQAVEFAAHVHRGPRVADRGGLVAEVHEGTDALGHQVLVDDRDDRHVEAHHGAELRGVVAGGVDDVLADDAVVVADHLPAPVGELAHGTDERVSADLGAELAGAAGHGVGAARRVGPAVVGGVDG